VSRPSRTVLSRDAVLVRFTVECVTPRDGTVQEAMVGGTVYAYLYMKKVLVKDRLNATRTLKIYAPARNVVLEATANVAERPRHASKANGARSLLPTCHQKPNPVHSAPELSV